MSLSLIRIRCLKVYTCMQDLTWELSYRNSKVNSYKMVTFQIFNRSKKQLSSVFVVILIVSFKNQCPLISKQKLDVITLGLAFPMAEFCLLFDSVVRYNYNTQPFLGAIGDYNLKPKPSKCIHCKISSSFLCTQLEYSAAIFFFTCWV